MSKELRIIILAAGKGTRMNSDLPKVLHKLNDKAILDFVLDESELLNPKETILVVGFKKEQVISHTQHRANLKYATQMEQLGTGHAVLQTGDLLKNKEPVKNRLFKINYLKFMNKDRYSNHRNLPQVLRNCLQVK